MNTFLVNQPHPETRETSCTPKEMDAKRLDSVLETEADSVSAIYFNNTYFTAVIDTSKRKVTEYAGNTVKILREEAVILESDKDINSVTYFIYQNKLFCAVCKENEVVLFKRQEESYIQYAILPVAALYATVCVTEKEAYLVYNGKMQVLSENLTALEEEAIEIKAEPYFISQGRHDKLFDEKRTNPGDFGGQVIFYKKQYFYFVQEAFYRCGRKNLDTFVCMTDDLKKGFQRRYLVLPNGGMPSVFLGEEDKLYVAFTGATVYSAVYKKAAVTELVYVNEEFLRPDTAYYYESTPVDALLPKELPVMIRDTFIFNDEDGYYYLTGTTARENGTFWTDTNGVCLWRSKNLESFEFVGKVFDYKDTPDSWQNHVSNGKNTWAPEIVYAYGTYFITYSTAPGCGLLKSISGKPEGPYKDMGRVVMKGIDSGFFMDGEELYLIWQNGRIAKINREGNCFTEEPVLLLPEDGQQVGYEGAGLIKIAGKYVLYAAEWNGDERIDGTYDMMYSVSDSLYGPYSKRKCLVPHGGHGCLFFNKENELMFTMFGNDRTAPFNRSVGIGRLDYMVKDGELTFTLSEE